MCWEEYKNGWNEGVGYVGFGGKMRGNGWGEGIYIVVMRGVG